MVNDNDCYNISVPIVIHHESHPVEEVSRVDYLSFEVKKEEKGHTLHPKDPKAPLEFMSTRTRVRIPSRLGTKRKHAEFTREEREWWRVFGRTFHSQLF